MQNIRSISFIVGVLLASPLSSRAFSPPNSQWGITTTVAKSAAASLAATPDDESDLSPNTFDMNRAKIGAVSLLSASVLMLTGIAGPLPVQPAFAAPPASTTTTTQAKKPASSAAATPKKPVAVDPLASEKASLAATQRSIAAADADLSALRKELSAEQKVLDKAVGNTQGAEKRVKGAKAALIDANDKLIAEKAKGSTTEGSLKTTQKLGEKVGTARTTLQAEETYLNKARTEQAGLLKARDAADKKVTGATKTAVSAKAALPKSQKKLAVAEKKLAKSNALAKKKAAKEAKIKAKKDKIAKKKAQLAEKKRQKEAKAAAKKKAAEIAALKSKVKQLKNVEKESGSELIKQEKQLQKISK